MRHSIHNVTAYAWVLWDTFSLQKDIELSDISKDDDELDVALFLVLRNNLNYLGLPGWQHITGCLSTIEPLKQNNE